MTDRKDMPKLHRVRFSAMQPMVKYIAADSRFIVYLIDILEHGELRLQTDPFVTERGACEAWNYTYGDM